MPTIKIPETLTITVDATRMTPAGPVEEPFTFEFPFVENFMWKTVLRDKQWGVNTDMIYAAMEIRGSLKGRKPGDEVEFTEDQWRKLCDVTKSPSDPYRPEVMMEAKTYLEAILRPHKT